MTTTPRSQPDNTALRAPRRPKLRAALSMDPRFIPWVLPEPVFHALRQHLELDVAPLSEADLAGAGRDLSELQVLVTGWNSLRLDHDMLDRLPNLKLVLHAGGTVRFLTTEVFWERNIPVTSAAAANAVPTAHFAEAAILLGLKHAWHYLSRRDVVHADYADTANSGIYEATVGIIGLSRVGRIVVENLLRKDARILAYDPLVSTVEAERLGVQLVPLERLFAETDVVSLHAPLLPETHGLITGSLVASMKSHATFVNTARGAIVREAELVSVLTRRRDLSAVLDVTDPEPVPLDSPLRRLPNVFLTPHIAGSRHRECARLGLAMAEELARFLAGEPLRWQVTREVAAIGA